MCGYCIKLATCARNAYYAFTLPRCRSRINMISFVSFISGTVLKDSTLQSQSECRRTEREAHRTGAPQPERALKVEEEVGIFAPVSTTGILGLIIQMWMLLLENTRS